MGPTGDLAVAEMLATIEWGRIHEIFTFMFLGHTERCCSTEWLSVKDRIVVMEEEGSFVIDARQVSEC